LTSTPSKEFSEFQEKNRILTKLIGCYTVDTITQVELDRVEAMIFEFYQKFGHFISTKITVGGKLVIIDELKVD
jgi:hypothetical protein